MAQRPPRKQIPESQGVSRRELLTGAGGLTLALGAVTLASAEARAADSWDRETDILVVGGGAAGCAAAVTADELGDAVLVVEKAPITGGTASKSAGVLWIPNNFSLREKGIEDDKQSCLRYMARFSYPDRYHAGNEHLGLTEREYRLLEAFYDHAAPAIDALQANGDLRIGEWRMFALDRSATDYLDNVPENTVPTGRALGPLKSDGSMGLGADLMLQYSNALKKREIPVLTNHPATRLVKDSAGRVIGLECANGDQTVRIHARKAVIFGTGGYAHNTEYTEAYQRGSFYGACAMPWSTGDFIAIGGAAGAQMGDLSTAWRSQVVLEEALRARTLAAGVFFPPGDSMVQVNRHGVRAVNEKRNYNDRTEVHQQYDASRAEYPNQLMFMVYDRRTAEAFAGAYPIPANSASSPNVLQGDTLQQLTQNLSSRLGQISNQTGGFTLSADFTANLDKTIKRFNGFARSGVDEDFLRGTAAYDTEWHQVFSPLKADSGWSATDGPNITMHPFMEEGPYYAIILAAGALDTSGGPAINHKAQVLDTHGQPIAGLYGAGNCIASPSSEAYYGAGHTLGMATAFGYIAARQAHEEPGHTA